MDKLSWHECKSYHHKHGIPGEERGIGCFICGIVLRGWAVCELNDSLGWYVDVPSRVASMLLSVIASLLVVVAVEVQ